MKRWQWALIVGSVCAGLLVAQTAPAPGNIAGAIPSGAALFGIGPNGTIVAVRLDPTLQVVADATTNSLLLRAVIPAPPAQKTRVVVVKPTVAATTLTLPTAPKGPVDVSCNGFVLTEGEDYTISGTTLTFVARWSPRVGDLFRLRYEE